MPRQIGARLLNWIARWLGLDLVSDLVLESLDDHEISEQLQYGRD